jgi:hypothetical protein
MSWRVALVAAVATVLGAAIGAVGSLIGAWFNSRLTVRRERWTFKRDLYVRLLEHLRETAITIEEMIRTRTLDKFPTLSAEMEEVRRARSIAALFLHRETIAALDHLDATWRRLHAVEGHADTVTNERLAAVGAAYEAVLAAGRKDLGL